jgi:hypothetical protein
MTMTALTSAQIDAIEAAVGIRLRLLMEFGPGPVGGAAEIYHPSSVRDLCEPFFDDPAQLFDPYFPFGCQNRNQELWVIDAAAERAASIWHETVPDDWPDEQWLPYDDRLARHFDPERPSSA